MQLILALDAGTTGVRCVAFNAQLEVIEEAYRELTQYFPSPGEVEHDPEEIAALAISTLRDVATQVQTSGHSILALGITNQRETTVGFDRERGQAFHRAIVWQDRRTSDYCQELVSQGHEDVVRETTGLVLDSYFSSTKIHWMLERGLADDALATSFSTIDTWLIWKLTGGVNGGTFVTEASNASRTQLMDLHTLAWSPEMLTLFGVREDMLATILPSSSTVGVIDKSVLPELAGVPITGVLGDQQSALFGQACFSPGRVKATYGTGAFLLANAGPVVPPVAVGLLTSVAWNLETLGTNYLLEGSAFVAGAAVQWLRDLGFIEESSDLEALALSVENSSGVQFVPAFTGLGSPFWRPDARGAITGLSRGVGKGEIARALVEALAYQVRAMTDAFRASGVSLLELRADGGAAAMDLLLQLQATNSRIEVLRSSSLEATARGAASIAGLGVGLWNSLDELEELWRPAKHFSPEDPVLVDVGYATWRSAIDRI